MWAEVARIALLPFVLLVILLGGALLLEAFVSPTVGGIAVLVVLVILASGYWFFLL